MTPINLKLKILNTSPEIYRNYSIRKMIKNHRLFLVKKIERLEDNLKKHLKYMNIPDLEALDDGFVPSRTAITGLNFISNDQAEKLKHYKIDNEIIADITRILYILMREKYDKVETEYLMINLFINIMPKYNIVNISIKFILFIKNL